MKTQTGAPSVPLKALLLSLLALVAAVSTSVLWPDVLFDQQTLASVLALIPAFLLAFYRGWAGVSALLGIGMVALALLQVLRSFLGAPFGTFPLVLLLVAPYVAIALGAGWFGEVRQSAANLRTARLQLIQAERLESIGRLAAGVAHEVKNPLMTILTGVKLLSKRLPADEPTQTLLRDMTDAVNRADTIVGGLLSYSRQQELKPEFVDLNALIERALLLSKHELDRKRSVVVKDLSPSLPPVELDAFKIEQVFINLITNAVQAMPEEGELTLRTFVTTAARARKDGYWSQEGPLPGESIVVAQVDDTGPGIPAEYLGKVFDPFFTTKPPGVGTGLGLSVSRQIVELHGGRIEIANREPKGTRVTMVFRLKLMENHA